LPRRLSYVSAIHNRAIILYRSIKKIIAIAKSLADDSRTGSWRRWWAARRLARLATKTDGRELTLNPAMARLVVEGLVAGLESVQWESHLICRHALERIRDQQLIEAVCDILLEQDLPRLRIIAVHAHYEPKDQIRRAAYLFVIGRLQFYEVHDPEGLLLEQFYISAPQLMRKRILGLARTWEDRCWERLIMAILRSRGWSAMNEVELIAAVEMLTNETQSPEGVY
jgi:hypothetical protein